MARWEHRCRRTLRASILILTLGLIAVPCSFAERMTDDQFIASLGDETDQSPVRRVRLARAFFSLAATLDGGKSSVRLLQGTVTVSDSSRLAVVSLLRSRFGDYETSLRQFRGSVADLLDNPDSNLLLHKVLTNGQRACWNLDLYYRLIETYGTDVMDMMSVVSSREACNKLRTAAFQPRVESIVRDALVEQIIQRRHIAELEAELAEAEQFLKDMLAPGEAD